MGTFPTPPYYNIDWEDSALETTPLAVEALTRGQARVEWWLRNRASTALMSLRTIRDFHYHLFVDLFPEFAGRLRGTDPQHVPVNVSFGSFRGAPREDVPRLFEALSLEARNLTLTLDDLQDSLNERDFAEATLKVASFVHCKLVEIHPFRNGNGRTARVCINYFAWRYGMLALPLVRPGGEYELAIGTWIRHRAIGHFMDFLRPSWRRRPLDSY